LGNAVYQQERYQEAQKLFEASAKMFESKTDKANAYHNLGNVFLSQKQYQKSIEAYKNALKLNPSDMETKYNLAYAKKNA
jgi:Ca-activated chloride channel homolog